MSKQSSIRTQIGFLTSRLFLIIQSKAMSTAKCTEWETAII